MKIGYARVSTPDQNPALQLEALEKAGCEKIYQEKKNKKDKNTQKKQKKKKKNKKPKQFLINILLKN